MSIQTVERPAVTVVGLHIRTKPMSPEIPALWPKFVARIPEIQHQTEPHVTYGVMRHAEATFESLDYMAAVAVSDAHRIPDGLTRGSLPAGTYAAFSYSLSRLGQGFHDIFNRLLPDSGWIQAPGPYFERYGASFDPKNPESAVEILIPVKR